MANGNPSESEVQVPRFFILRTFSKVKPEKMAAFMNAITWQAAWLRYYFQWDRVVVGYALTDIPERVLEITASQRTTARKRKKVLRQCMHKMSTRS